MTSAQRSGTRFDAWLAVSLEELRGAELFRERAVTVAHEDGTCTRDGRRVLNFASNDYLNLSHDPRVRSAVAAVAQETAGAGASPLVSGRSEWHERLEQSIAAFEGTDAAVLFPSGYAANLGTLTALMGPEDIVFCDRLNHASLIDGCRLTRAEFEVYRTENLAKLALRMERSQKRAFIVTDGVFSMDGRRAPIAELLELADTHGATLIVDEAHGTGVIGANGRGACEAAGVEDRVPVRIGTLSKAVGLIGGFATGSRDLIDWLWNRARPQFFSTALPAAVCAGCIEAIRIIGEQPERRRELQAKARQLREWLGSAGVMVDGVDVPILPVVLGDERSTVNAAERLLADGFLVGCIRPPTVPAGQARLRISITSAHSDEDLQRLASAVIQVARPTRGDSA